VAVTPQDSQLVGYLLRRYGAREVVAEVAAQLRALATQHEYDHFPSTLVARGMRLNAERLERSAREVRI
jgi:hypothetical protein